MARPRPTRTIAHLSDLHINGDGSLLGGVVDARARLAEALGVLTSWNVACDAWVFSGDLSDDGSEASYAWLREKVAAASERAGVPVIWANGNHDERSPFRTALLGEAASDEPYLAEHVIGGQPGSYRDAGRSPGSDAVDGLRVLVVDSTVPGLPHGRLAPQTLAWLAERLAAPASEGTVLVMHHAPLPPLQDAAWGWVLAHPEQLAEVVRGSDVSAILSGHFHHSAFGVFAGVGASIAPSLVYTQDVTVGRDLRGQAPNAGFSVAEFYPDVVTHTVVPLETGAAVVPLLEADPLPQRP